MHNNQQSRRAPVAPFNLNPQWPQGYFRVLQELRVEKPRHPFYAHWVRQLFNQFQRNRHRRNLGRTDSVAITTVLSEKRLISK